MDEHDEQELIAKGIADFIRNHTDPQSFQGLVLNEESVQGRRVRERSDLLLLGDWVIQGVPPRLTARWSSEIAQGESVRVEVRLEKRGVNYLAVDWDVKNTF